MILHNYILNYLAEFWALAVKMSPSLLFGFFIAGMISVFISAKFIEKKLGKPGIGSIVKASLFGIPLPVCSCGVIPLTLALREHGASRGAVCSFLISTPQTGLDSLLVTYIMLGPTIAIFRPLFALISGVIGGGISEYCWKSKEKSIDKPETKECCSGSCCDKEDPNSKAPYADRFIQGLRYGFVSLFGDVAIPLFIGLAVATMMTFLIPEQWLESFIGVGIGASLVSMLAMTVVGIPLYVCATASVPIAAVLLMKGVPPGAVFVFLVTGPATNIASLSALGKVLGVRFIIKYVTAVILSAFLGGIILNSLIPAGTFSEVVITGKHQCTSWWEILCTVILSFLTLHSIYIKFLRFFQKVPRKM